jgi:aspartate/methionine/tyrosine aminotransferase
MKDNSWLVIDETYHEFLHENTVHTLPCAKRLEYENIIHISSFSKSFGMAGWRVGYLAYPNKLNTDLRKVCTFFNILRI